RLRHRRGPGHRRARRPGPGTVGVPRRAVRLHRRVRELHADPRHAHGRVPGRDGLGRPHDDGGGPAGCPAAALRPPPRRPRGAPTAGASLIARHGSSGPTAVTEANGAAAGAGLLAPLAIGGAVGLGWGWRPAMVLMVALTGLLFVLRGRLTRGAVRTADAETP